MAQTSSFVIANDAGAAVRARINEVIAALQSTSAGASAPTATTAGMLWVDTSVSPPVLRRRTLQVRPDPGREHDAPAVGQPLEGLDAGPEGADALGFPAVGRDQVELRRLVPLALPAAAGDEGDAVAARRPGGLAVAVAGRGQAPRPGAPGRRG